MTVAGSPQVGACLAYGDTWWGSRGHGSNASASNAQVSSDPATFPSLTVALEVR